MLAPLHPAQLAAEPSGAVHRDFFRWLGSLLNIASTAAPPYVIAWLYLDADGVATQFDATGLGGGHYLGWAICNGNNGTPDLNDTAIIGRTAGAAQLPFDSIVTGSDIIVYRLVPIMRVQS